MKFKIGEVVILQDLTCESEQYNGEEVVIKKYIGMVEFLDGICASYEVMSPFLYNRLNIIAERCMRRKKLPQELSTWVEVKKTANWKPDKIKG